MRRLLRLLRKKIRPRETLITVNVYRDHLLHNLHTFQQAYSHTPIAPVLKSNAYGHGLVEVATVLDNEGLPFFVVDSRYEARFLRIHGIKTLIVVIGYTVPELIAQNHLRNVSFTLTSLEGLRELAACVKKPTPIHLKIDTGMHRQGILPSELDDALEILNTTPALILEGVCSHFASAYTKESPQTQTQMKVWNEVVDRIRESVPTVRYVHLAATAGTAYRKEFEANVHRLGIGLYGIDSFEGRSLALQPALSLETIVTSVRTLKKGETIGYNATFTAPNDMRVATIPLGYAEGLDRRLSNPPVREGTEGNGLVEIKEVMCPILGRVSMNITSVDVTGVPDIKIGERVTVFGADSSKPNAIVAGAARCGTIPYELLVHIPQYLRRRMV